MREQEARKVADKLERKEKIMTSGGPVMEVLDDEWIKSRAK